MNREDGGSVEISELAKVDLNLLVALQLMLKERSVTRAAERMGLSQPAMSRSLARCRRLLNDELLVRVGSALEPTARGRALLDVLSEILDRIDQDVLTEPSFDPASSTRRFTVSATSTTALVVLPNLLERLADNAPGVTVQVLPGLDTGDELQRHPDIDVALIADRVPSSLPRERLYEDRWVVATRQGLITGEPPLALRDMAALPHVAFRAQTEARTQPYAELKRLGVTCDVRLSTDDFLLLPALVAGTDHLAIVQEKATETFVRAGLIETFPLPFEVRPLGLDMVFNPRLSGDPAIGWLRHQLLGAAGHTRRA